MAEATGGEREAVIPAIRVMRAPDREQRATFFELFFDLVYVFAITQLSHHLLATHVSWAGAAETVFMLIAVYWAWNYTTWMANWFDPDTAPVRLILAFVMLASLLMAVAIPAGFGDQALLFACSYCALQIGRNAFVVAITPPGVFNHNFRQILAWSVLSAPLWVAGGLVDDLRWLFWLVALGLDLAGPLARFWLPRVGPTPMRQWEINGQHFAERFQLFVIIALGENIVLTGVTASSTDLSASTVVALCLAFVGSATLWWLYFGGVGQLIVARIASGTADEVGALGRDIFTYLHLPIIAGIVLAAVGDEIVVAHPHDELGVAGALAVLGGPALYVIGLMGSGLRAGHRIGWSYVLATVFFVAAIPLAAEVSGLVGLGLAGLLLVALAATDYVLGSGRARRHGVAAVAGSEG